jgi:hypothetical protein
MKEKITLKNILIVIVLIAINIVYFIKNENRQIEKDLAFRKKGVEDCINASDFKNIDSAIIRTVCECGIDKLIEQYGISGLKKMDKKSEDELLMIVNKYVVECALPYQAEMRLKRLVYNCVEAATNNGSLTTVEAEEFCNCSMEYILSKYDYDTFINNEDSILNIEIEAITECFNLIKNSP